MALLALGLEDIIKGRDRISRSRGISTLERKQRVRTTLGFSAFLMILLFACASSGLGNLHGQEPPVDEPEVSTGDDLTGSDESDVQQPDEEFDPLDILGGEEGGRIGELVNEISENFRKIEDLLNRKDTGADNQGLQTRTIDKIDLLIDEVEKATQSSSGAGSTSSSQQKPQEQSSSEDQRQGSQQQKIDQQGGSPEEKNQTQQQGGEPDNPGDSRFDQTSEGELPPGEQGNLNDREGRGRWGRLPRTVIEKMYDNGRRKLPEKYRILLEDYFRRLPERGSQ